MDRKIFPTGVTIVLGGNTALPCAVVAEWLRRLTRNQIPSGSVGSNPTDCGKHFWQPPSPSSFCNRYLVLFYTFPLMRLILSRPFFAVLLITIIYILPCSNLSVSIVGSVVECSPATRAARVRFPDDANFFFSFLQASKCNMNIIVICFSFPQCKEKWPIFNFQYRGPVCG